MCFLVVVKIVFRLNLPDFHPSCNLRVPETSQDLELFSSGSNRVLNNLVTDCKHLCVLSSFGRARVGKCVEVSTGRRRLLAFSGGSCLPRAPIAADTFASPDKLFRTSAYSWAPSSRDLCQLETQLLLKVCFVLLKVCFVLTSVVNVS